jgi:O-antigen/teichoic acid export membrane protein
LSAGFILTTINYGSFGIVLAILINLATFAIPSFVLVRKKFGFRLGDLKYCIQIIKEGLSNTPFKISRLLVMNLSVVLLGIYNIPNSDIGLFYMSITISSILSGFALSMAQTAIPSSSVSKTDLSSQSLKISLGLTSPLIAFMIIAPAQILSLVGKEYSSAYLSLQILAIAVFPSSVVINMVSKFNNYGEIRRLTTIGIIQMLSFLISFFILVPHLGTMGAALSVLTSFITAAILSMVSLDKFTIKFIVLSALSIVCGVLCGFASIFLINLTEIVAALIAFAVSSVLALSFKIIKITEIAELIKQLIKKTK